MKAFKRMLAFFAVVVILSSALPATFAQADSVMTVTASYLYLRSQPGVNGVIVGGARKGASVTVLTDGNWKYWYHVRLANGQTGYMYKSYLRASGSAASNTSGSNSATKTSNTTAASGTAVTNHKANLRTGPGYKFNVITLMGVGTSLTILGKSGNWYYVRTSGGVKGYVLSRLLDVKSNSGNSNNNSNNSNASVAGKSAYTNHKANMRTGASSNYAVMHTLDAGEWLTVLSSYGNWYKVRYNNKTGYIMKRLVNIVE